MLFLQVRTPEVRVGHDASFADGMCAEARCRSAGGQFYDPHASTDRLVQLWKRWSASRKIAIRILSPWMDSKLLDELHGVWREGALRIPGSDIPTPDRSAAMDQRYSMDLPARDQHAGRNHRDAIAGRGQSDQCLRSSAFKEDARSDAGDLASSMEPLARGKTAAQQQQGVIREFLYIKGCAAAEAVTGRQNRKDMDRVQQPRVEPFIAFRHDGEVHVAAFKSVR